MSNSDTENSTLSSIAHLVSRTLLAYQIDSNTIFDKAGIDLSKLHNAEDRIPSFAMQKVWHMAVTASGDPCFGITLAENIQPSALHGLGFSWIASDTLKNALERLARYFRILVSTGEVILEEQGDYLCLWLKIPPHNGKIAFASLDAALGIFVQMCRITASSTFSPSSIELQRGEPSCKDRLVNFFDCPVTFSANENRIFFHKKTLDTLLPTANPALARVNDQIVIDYLARFDRSNFSNQVRAFVIERLPVGIPSQEMAADSLFMSVRNLQRKLQVEGNSFKQILDDVRQQLAEQYLKEKQRSLGEITYMLGFTEPSNFTRAFKRWTGVSPQEYRGS